MDVQNSPIYATGVGLVLWGAENSEETPRKFKGGGSLNKLWKWLGDIYKVLNVECGPCRKSVL